jgi:hypothetical protein
MKKIKSFILFTALLFFATGLENCNVKTKSYCQKEVKKINCRTKKMYEQESPSNIFPEKDLIIKI